MFACPRVLSLLMVSVSLVLSACLFPAAPPASSSKQVIVVKPNQLNFITEAGRASIAEQVIAISTPGGGQLDWTISDSALWINLDQLAAAENSTISTVKVRLDASGMPAGSYMGLITVQAGAALNSPVFVPVYLDVLVPTGMQQPAPPAQKPGEARSTPTEASIVWQNRTAFMKYALVNACLVTGSITNTERSWRLADVYIVSKSGNQASIAQVIPPGETVMYRRYIPCYQYEEVNLKYGWQAQR